MTQIMVCEHGSYEMLNAMLMTSFDYHVSMDAKTWREKQLNQRRMNDAMMMIASPIYANYRVLEFK